MPSPFMWINRTYSPPGVVDTAYIDERVTVGVSYLSNNRPFRSTIGSYIVTAGEKPVYKAPPGSHHPVYSTRVAAPEIPFEQIFPSSP